MDQTQLLMYAEGELDQSEAAAAQKHLAECADCRVRMEQLRSDLDDLITRHRERKNAALRGGPVWVNLGRELDRLEGRKAAPRVLRFPARRTWAGLAAAGFIAALIWNLSTQRTVSAAELLRKASSRPEDSQPNRRIVIKAGRQHLIRPARLTGAGQPHAAATDDAFELSGLFERANFSWENPLSAHSFARWRDQLPEKDDQVSVLQTGADRMYRIRTTTAHGVLSQATLTMRTADLRAVRETLQFRGRELIEIAETAPADLGTPAVPRAPGTQIATEPPVPVETPVGPAEELRVLAALSEIGADLGEPIEVKRDASNRRITISGIDVHPRRQQQIRDVIRDIPGVIIAFSEGQPLQGTTPESADTVTAGRRSALHDQLEARLGAGERVDSFVDRIVAESESALARAHALRNLAMRFSPDVEQTLLPNDHQILLKLRERHWQGLAKLAQSIERQVTDVFGNGRTVRTPTCNSWQDCANALLAASRKFDEVLNAALAGVGGGKSPTAGDLVSALTTWRQQIAAFADVTGLTR